jgi:hypothetical protein
VSPSTACDDDSLKYSIKPTHYTWMCLSAFYETSAAALNTAQAATPQQTIRSCCHFIERLVDNVRPASVELARDPHAGGDGSVSDEP